PDPGDRRGRVRAAGPHRARMARGRGPHLGPVERATRRALPRHRHLRLPQTRLTIDEPRYPSIDGVAGTKPNDTNALHPFPDRPFGAYRIRLVFRVNPDRVAPRGRPHPPWVRRYN